MSSSSNFNFDYINFWGSFSFSNSENFKNENSKDEWESFSFAIKCKSKTLIVPLAIIDERTLEIRKKISKEFREARKARQEEWERKQREEREKRQVQESEKPTPTTFTPVPPKRIPKKNFSKPEKKIKIVESKHNENRKIKKNEKKILEKARSEFFVNPSLLYEESWLISIGQSLCIESPHLHIREIKDKLNLSPIEKAKVVKQDDEIVQVENSQLTEDQVLVLTEVERKDDEEIQTLASNFVNFFENAENQRANENNELEAMTCEEKESIVFNVEFSKSIAEGALMFLADFESKLLVSEDDFDIFSILKEKPKKKSFLKAFPIFENTSTVHTPSPTPSPKHFVLGVSSFEKPKKNRLCKSLKSGEPCEKYQCSFLHSFDELKLEQCKYTRCKKVKMIRPGKYENIEKGCPFAHQNETLENFLIRDGYLKETNLEESKCEHKCEHKSDHKVEYKPALPNPDAWKETNSKIYSHPTQKTEEYEKPKPKEKENEKENTQSKNKTKLCDSVVSGIPCRHGNKCRFAHSIEEFNVPKCHHGNHCLFVKKTSGGLFYNSNGRFCNCIHPEETKENYLSRNNITVFETVEVKTTKTKICNSILTGRVCLHKKCNFAHSETELNIRPCIFPCCKLISVFENVIVNIDQRNKCRYFHEGETKRSYFERMMA